MNRLPSDAADQLRGRRFITAEFMYRPRPREPRARQVFDFALNSRLEELSRCNQAAVLLICDSAATGNSFADLPSRYPGLTFVTAIVNPEPIAEAARDTYADTPAHAQWNNPAHWRRYEVTDRWARILYALEVARQLPAPGYLIMPAHDAVWGRGLLAALTRLSEQHAQNGIPAAVSPYPRDQHSSVPGVDIPSEIIDALNAAFARDSWLRWRLRSGSYQAFWGKMGMIPFVCCDIVNNVETMIWEDDLEIDRVLRERDYAVVARMTHPSLYRQALPVFDRAGVRAVIERTLHYSLNIPGESSLLTRPLDRIGQMRKILSPRFAHALALSEAITAECQAEIAQRLSHYAMSWMDWGAYRYVVRVGDPLVQVWKYEGDMVQL
ncbi:MAG: hypothetical protein GC204_04725 [Chloroflexi bacterium]|nr:hypothetical protein [Chloroflexota bacterium]